MKTLLKVTVLVLLVSVMACGKNKRNNVTTKTPSNGAPQTEDAAQFKYIPADPNSPTKVTKFLMSDYIYLNDIQGDPNEKRLYAQVSLFFQPVTAADLKLDKDKKDQYSIFYREFVTCKDGPRPIRPGTVSTVGHLEPYSGIALRTKGLLNLTNNVGVVAKTPGKKPPFSARLTFSQLVNTHDFSKKPLVLNYKDSSETLEKYQAMPVVTDQTKAISALDCTNAGQPETQILVPFGSTTQTPAPPATSVDSATLQPSDSNLLPPDQNTESEDGQDS